MSGSGRRPIEIDPITSSSTSSETPSTRPEPWAEWIQRTTRQAEEQLDTYCISTCTSVFRKTKWHFGLTVWKMDRARWGEASRQFNASDDPTLFRRVGRPLSRCTDSLGKCVTRVYGKDLGESWRDVINDEESWLALELEFLRCASLCLALSAVQRPPFSSWVGRLTVCCVSCQYNSVI